MNTLKIWLALILLALAFFLLKLSYVTSNPHTAIVALIIGALFILSGLSLTMEEEKDYMKGYNNGYEWGRLDKSRILNKITIVEPKPKLQYMGEPSFKDKIQSEEQRMNQRTEKSYADGIKKVVGISKRNQALLAKKRVTKK